MSDVNTQGQTISKDSAGIVSIWRDLPSVLSRDVRASILCTSWLPNRLCTQFLYWYNDARRLLVSKPCERHLCKYISVSTFGTYYFNFTQSLPTIWYIKVLMRIQTTPRCRGGTVRHRNVGSKRYDTEMLGRNGTTSRCWGATEPGRYNREETTILLW